MNTATRILGLTAWYAIAGAAMAQTPPAAPPADKSTAQSEAGEPRADTSGPAVPSPAIQTPAPATSPAAAPAPATPAAKAPAGRTAPVAAGGQKSGSKTDRLELGTATVTGDREQPKVMYIVPWKRSDIGDLAGKPMNSLVDEILAPVDRDVFKREVVYYRAVQAETSQNGAPPKPAPQGEK
jgi:cytoskeletal protein RodZ